ncbi:MAG: ATP-grasp domain-containing protein [Gammaproteobacteria bacterium]
MESFLALIDPISFGFKYVHYAKKLGFKVIGIYTLDNFYIDNSDDSFCNIDICIHEKDISLILEKLSSIKNKIKGVVSCTEPGVDTACLLAHALHLPCNDPKNIQIFRNKRLMRDFLKNKSLPSIHYKVCKTISDVNEFLESNILPVVIKTPQGAGSDQVFFCRTKEDVNKNFNIIVNSKNLFGLKTSYALLENFIVGQEYVFDLFIDGKTVHLIDIWKYKKNINKLGGFIYEKAILQNMENNFFEKTYDYLKQILQNIEGINRGSIHAEVIINERGEPTLVEMGARIAGSGFAELIAESINFNPFIENIKVFTEENYSMPTESINRLNYSAVVFVPNDQYGLFKGIIGMDSALKLASYYKHKIYVQYGDTLTPTTDLQNNIALFFLKNTDKSQLLKDVDYIRQLKLDIISDEVAIN